MNKLCLLFLLIPLMLLTTIAPVAAFSEDPELFLLEAWPPMDEAAALAGGDIQMDRVSARILSRFGRYEESVALYQKLRGQYPDNFDVWEDYIETLVNFAEYDQALTELRELYQAAPSRQRANWLEARIYIELEEPEKTYPIYESLLRANPDDGSLWADYGNARLAAGDWQLALDCYSRALELKADSQEIIRSVHDILQKHRPRVTTGYRMYAQADHAETTTYWLNFRRHLGQENLLEFAYDRVSLKRPAGGGAGLDLRLEKPAITLRHQFNLQWQARAGLAPYSGLGDGTASLFGLDYAGRNYGVSAVYGHHEPWYEEADAAALDGSYDRSGLVVERAFARDWNCSLDLGYRKYFLQDGQEYGEKKSFTASLTRKLFKRPDFSVSYVFTRSLFDYEDDAVRTVSMLESEAAHALTGKLEYWWPGGSWGAFLAGGLRQDVARHLGSFVVMPGMRLRLGSRVTGEWSYEYLSEAGTAAGGKSTVFNLRLSVIF